MLDHHGSKFRLSDSIQAQGVALDLTSTLSAVLVKLDEDLLVEGVKACPQAPSGRAG